MLRIFCLCLVLWSSAQCQQWMTQYDQHFQFFCPPGQTIKALDSIHDNHHEDRVWNFTCIVPPHGATLSKCEWSGYINDFDQPVDYNCPNDGIICGIESVHDNHHEDRKWSYYCCFPEGFVTHACEDTPYENTYDHVLNYRVPDDFVLRGVQSVHDNRHEDRIFKFDICRLDAVGETVVG
ncbi:hemagglutinin/amebocyte aggregation factor-like [Biomphalaria glabrata]|uniref:Hemagglutinin/amebocyte aggregation factor-like n=1 Tax=Biomphalaria glabrata TaxID=6526 RepID=A0A9W3AZC4_BIOGL|nr:hemagglutinin/amebocyte aggregation factor-like [Biomphalaria glabrata]